MSRDSAAKKSPRPAPQPNAGSDRAEVDLLRQKIDELVRKNPGKAAVILSEWIGKAAGQLLRKKAG
ncbi:MAG: hypothetical protein NDJ89_17970 [Oligoflexia bacterium]|nr:hypothetical protein [Oligoflexia bacterium]